MEGASIIITNLNEASDETSMASLSCHSSACDPANVNKRSQASHVSSDRTADTMVCSSACSDCVMMDEESNSFSPPAHVEFGVINVREYNVELGNHPDCRDGPPLALGWRYRDLKRIDLETYEACRPPRRNPSELVMSFYERKCILRSSGVKDMEIYAAIEEVEKSNRDRLQTIKSLGGIKGKLSSVTTKVKFLLGKKTL